MNQFGKTYEYTEEGLEEILVRLEMASTVEMSADQARELVRLALIGLEIETND